MGEAKPVHTEGLLLDLDQLITNLSAQHKYWDVHLVGNDGVIRVEVNYKAGSYRTRGEGGSLITSRGDLSS